MAFVLAWTIGDPSSLVLSITIPSSFFFSMSNGIGTQSKLNSTIRCGSALTSWPWRLPGVLVVNPYNTSTPNHHMTHFANLNATVITHAEML
jgi:hypothetical protein